MSLYRLAVLESLQSYPSGAGDSRSGQVPLGKRCPLVSSGTQCVYVSVQLGGMPQLSYLRSIYY